jgi:hypothetical protein
LKLSKHTASRYGADGHQEQESEKQQPDTAYDPVLTEGHRCAQTGTQVAKESWEIAFIFSLAWTPRGAEFGYQI